MRRQGLVRQLQCGYVLSRQVAITITSTRNFESSCMRRLQSFSTNDDTNTTNNKNDGKESSSIFGSQASTQKLATWLDATIIKRKGIAFEASQELMSKGMIH